MTLLDMLHRDCKDCVHFSSKSLQDKTQHYCLKNLKTAARFGCDCYETNSELIEAIKLYQDREREYRILSREHKDFKEMIEYYHRLVEWLTELQNFRENKNMTDKAKKNLNNALASAKMEGLEFTDEQINILTKLIERVNRGEITWSEAINSITERHRRK